MTVFKIDYLPVNGVLRNVLILAKNKEYAVKMFYSMYNYIDNDVIKVVNKRLK